MREAQDDSDLKFLKPWCAWMKKRGWNVMVAGDYRIQGRDRFNFEFVINFTGMKKEDIKAKVISERGAKK